MPTPPKINFTELNVPKDNFTEYLFEWKPIFRIYIAESILPEWRKIWKCLQKNFICEVTGKTVKKFQTDPEKPLNKLPIREIDKISR